MSNLNDEKEKTKLIQPFKLTAKTWALSVIYLLFPKIFKEKTNLIARIFYALLFLALTALTCLILISNVLAYYEYYEYN